MLSVIKCCGLACFHMLPKASGFFLVVDFEIYLIPLFHCFVIIEHTFFF